jgi:serine phosphatase RsbU (regulator of sigma subunit)
VSTIAVVIAIIIYLLWVNKTSVLVSVEEKEAERRAIISGMEYANNIQKNLLPLDSEMEKAFSDYSVIWEPRDIVSGDIYWMKRFDEGTVLCVCDCTGHGTSGALLSMLVVSVLEAAVRPDNCHDTAKTIWQLEQRLVDVFSVKTGGRGINDTDILDGCDLAVLFIAKDGNIALSAGNTNVFICDGNCVQRFKGQRIFVGEGKLNNEDDVKTINIPAKAGNKFYIASDGLFDQPGGANSRPFGYKTFEKIILDHHGETQNAISANIWTNFEKYRGNEPRVDDFTLFTFKL